MSLFSCIRSLFVPSNPPSSVTQKHEKLQHLNTLRHTKHTDSKIASTQHTHAIAPYEINVFATEKGCS